MAVVACIWLEPVVTCYLYIHLTSHLHCVQNDSLHSLWVGSIGKCFTQCQVMIEKVFVSCLITDDIDSAPDDSEVHFERFEQEHSLAQGLEPRDGRQGGSLLGCLMGCTRELRVGFELL